MPSWNEKALGLNSRKAVRWLSVSHSGFQYLLNLLQSWRMWRLDSIGYSPHGQLKSSLEKNLRRYSPIGAWFRMARAALAHNELECPKCLIHGPPFLYEGSMLWKLSSRRSRNCFPLRSDAWKVICQFLMILSHSSFSLKSHNVLDGDMGIRLNFFVSLSTAACRDHLASLGQSQSSMTLEGCLLKNDLIIHR